MPVKIALVSPSGIVEQSQIEFAIKKAEELSVEIVSKTCERQSPEIFLNGCTDERLLELTNAENLLVDAIWCARGGFGAILLWSEYQKSIYQDHQAVLIGYSDITIYHFMRFYRAHRIGIHGPIFLDLLKTKSFFEPLELLIQKDAQKLVYPALKSINHFLPTKISGELIPMNLVSLQSIVGCFDPGFFKGKILAIEDIREQPYKVYRTLLHFKNAGLLYGLKALIIGHFSEDRPQVLKLSELVAKDLGLPLFDWPIFGHDEPNWPLLFGAKVSIDKVDDKYFTLAYDEQHDHTPIRKA